MSLTPDLKAPVLLLATPQIDDPFFRKSVVLLVHHDGEGSFGFIVNRPTNIRVRDILEGLEIEWEGPEGSLAHLGGPVQTELGTVLFTPSSSYPLTELKGDTEVASGNFITHHIDDLNLLAGQPPGSLRLFLGYAGWGADQLISEISRNDWLTAPVQDELIYCPDPDAAWEKALRSAGIDPTSLQSSPTRTALDDENPAN